MWGIKKRTSRFKSLADQEEGCELLYIWYDRLQISLLSRRVWEATRYLLRPTSSICTTYLLPLLELIEHNELLKLLYPTLSIGRHCTNLAPNTCNWIRRSESRNYTDVNAAHPFRFVCQLLLNVFRFMIVTCCALFFWATYMMINHPNPSNHSLIKKSVGRYSILPTSDFQYLHNISPEIPNLNRKFGKLIPLNE